MSTSPMLPAAEIAVRTDPGRDPDKAVNEDNSVYKETGHGWLVVVCDGMGGHASGREASELAINTIVEIIESAPIATSSADALKRAIEEANVRVWAMRTAEAGHRPGSTVVAVLIHEGGAEVAHVGDSRLYLVHAGAISQVTRDHSMVQELVDRNLIRPEDAAKHPDSNKILRALGIGKDVEVDLRAEPVPYVSGDVFILCSDGLSDLVEPADILDIAGSHPPEQAAGQLVDLANARGGHDNITAMVVLMRTSSRVRESAGFRPIAKTIPLTAHQTPIDAMPVMPPTLHAYGHGGPLHPMGTQPGAPLLPMPPGSGPGLPHAPPVAIPPAPRSSTAPGPSMGLVVLGISLAFLAIALAVAMVAVGLRPKHRPVGLVTEASRHDAAVEEMDAGPELPTGIVPAPPLTVDASTGRTGARDGGGDPCGALRRARDRDADPGVIDRLTDKCRAAGGAP